MVYGFPYRALLPGSIPKQGKALILRSEGLAPLNSQIIIIIVLVIIDIS